MESRWSFAVAVLTVGIFVYGAATAQAVHQAGPERGPGGEKLERQVGFSLGGDSLLGSLPLDNAITNGSFDAEAGLYFEGEDPEDSDSYSYGTIYIEALYETAPFMNGLQLGIGGIAVNEAWDDEDEPWGDNYDADGSLNAIYANYTFPGSKTSLLVGRDKFEKPATGNGDSHEGIQLTIGDVPNLKVYAAVIKKWIDDSGPDEIEPERNLSESNAEAGDYAYSLLLEWSNDYVSLAPYAAMHKDVATTYGVEGDLSFPINDSIEVGLDGIYAVHAEDTPASVSSTDDDLSQRLIHGRAAFNGFEVGVGNFSTSDDMLADGAKLFADDVSPLEELDDLAADSSTNYVDASYDFGALAIGGVYGDVTVDDTPSDAEAQELDLTLEANVTERISVEFLYADVSFDDDIEEDYVYYEGGVAISF
jgi:hypothetical protein